MNKTWLDRWIEGLNNKYIYIFMYLKLVRHEWMDRWMEGLNYIHMYLKLVLTEFIL